MTMLAQNTFTVKRATKDGYSCSLSSYSVMLNADSNGVVNGLSAASTAVKLYQGSTAVTPVISIDSVSNCSASISGLNVSIASVPNNTKSGYVDIKIVYGSFIKIERYTFTVVDYTIVKSYTQTIVGDQMTSYATKATVDALGNTVSDHSSKIQQNASAISSTVSSVDKLSNRVSTAETAISQFSGQIALKASQSDVTALGNRMTSAEAKITPDAINLTVKSQSQQIASDAAKRTSITVDASSLDVNTYYPILIQMNSTVPYTITVERTLAQSMGVPSYSTHESGFSVFCKWTSNGSGRGTIDIKRVIHLFQYRFTANNIPPIGSIGQMSNRSLEFIYVRGGSKYNVLVEGDSNVNIQLVTSTYTTDYPTYTQTINLLTSVEAPTPDMDLRPTTDEIKSQFTIDTGGISMLGKKISLSGMVTFSSLASDAQNKISSAQSAADAANSAAGKAQSTADGKASTTYVDDAKGAAISVAASDATTKAGQAKTDAINAAALDATGKANTALSSAKGYTDTLKGSLGTLAWESTVGLAKLDNTIIDGGYIKTNLIDAVKIVTQGISAQTIDAGNATFKNLTVDTVKMTNADVSGKITATSGTFMGTLSGVSGSFKSLMCVDNDNNEVGEITFNSGKVTFNSCDLQHQGLKNNRTLRFLTSNIWCRGTFGSATKNFALVTGNIIKYYVNGEVTGSGSNINGDYVQAYLPTQAYNGNTYYNIPLYGDSTSGITNITAYGNCAVNDVKGFPVEIVIFNATSGSYRYCLMGNTGKEVLLINANDGFNNIYYASCEYVAHQLKGGEIHKLVNCYSFMNPQKYLNSIPYSGWMLEGYYDNNF